MTARYFFGFTPLKTRLFLHHKEGKQNLLELAPMVCLLGFLQSLRQDHIPNRKHRKCTFS